MARKISVEIVGDAASLERAFGRAKSSSRGFTSDLSKTSRGVLAATVSMKGLGRAVAFSSAQFLGGAGIAFAAKSVIQQASRIQEETEKTGVVFGANARQVQAWSKTLAQSFGVSEGAALEAAGVFGNMLRPLGFAEKAAASMSQRLVELAADMASFNNTKPDVVLEALQSGLAGQVRPLRQFGVFLSQARIQTEAYQDGIAKVGAKLTQAQKVQAAYNIILKDTKLQQGDVARNSESLSVAMSKLTAGTQNLEAGLGRALLPSLTRYVNKAGEWLNQTENQQRIQRDFAVAVKDTSEVLRGAKTVVDGIDKATGSLKNTLELLLALKVGATVAGWAASFGLLAKSEKAVAEAAVVTRINQYTAGVAATGATAATSAAKVSALSVALRRLGAIGVVATVVEVVIHRKSLDDFERRVTGAFTRAQQGGFTDALAKTEAKIANIVPGVHVDWHSLTKAIDDQTKQDPPVLSPTFTVNPKIQNVTDQTVKQMFPAGLKQALKDALEAAGAGDTSVGGGGSRSSGVSAGQRNTFFDNAIARMLQRGGLGTINQQIAALEKANQLIGERLKATKDVTRRLNLEDEVLGNVAQIKSLKAQQAADALQARQDAMQEFIAKLQLGLTKAQATAGFNDDIAALKALQAGIKREISEFGKTADLSGQLFDVQQQLAQARTAQLTAKQFKQLGLTATGDEPTPGVAGLKKRLAQLTANVSASSLNTPKLQAELARFRKVLGDNLFPPTLEVRAKIKEMMDTVADQLKGHGALLDKSARANQAAILKGIGLDPAQIKALKGRLSQVGVDGRVPIPQTATGGAGAGTGGMTFVQHTTIKVDNDVLARAVTKSQQRSKVRNPDQRRGLFPGGA